MKIGMAQINTLTGDLQGNADKIAGAIHRARSQGCDLVVLPEMAVTGYMTGDLLEIDDFVKANERLLHERIVPQCEDIVAVVGYVRFSGETGSGQRLHNAAAVIQNGRIVATADKQNLCRYRFYDETRYFRAGESTTVTAVSLAGAKRRMGVLICEDLWEAEYPVNPYRDAAQAGADLIVVVNCSPFETGKWRSRRELIRRHQRQYPLPVVYVNTTGVGDNLKDLILFDGRSMLLDPAGTILGRGPLFADGLVAVDLDAHHQAPDPHLPVEPEEEVLKAALVFGLREYCRQTGFNKVLLGMSGGVDSSLCAAIAAMAMGPDNVLGIMLPSVFSSIETRRSAEAVCRNTGIRSMEMPIDDLHQRVVAVFERHRRMRRRVTDENIQARLRGLLLMAMANDSGRMVVATGNKTELGLGYCTLYGDMVGGLLLIGDLNKMQVYGLAAHINRHAGRDMIPREVMERQPSAELAADQSDPFDYALAAPMVDDLIARVGPGRIMTRFREGRLDDRYPADIGETHSEARFRDTLQDVYGRYQAAAFKRAQASPTVIVSNRALGFDLRETIINKWSPDWR